MNCKKSGLEFRAETVATREQFIQKLLEQSFDIIIADYRLPGWTGMDALAEIKRLGLNIPVILVTGALGEGVAVESLKQGITDYILKDQVARLPAAVIRAQEEKTSRDAETRAVEALRASETRYRGLVENATYGMHWVTADGALTAGESSLCSHAWLRFGTGSPRDTEHRCTLPRPIRQRGPRSEIFDQRPR